jgi:hypothetical protein
VHYLKYQREHRQTNKDYYKQKNKKEYEKYKDKRLAYAREYRRLYPHKIIEYRQKSRERYREYYKTYYEKNSDLIMIKRLARELDLKPFELPREVIELKRKIIIAGRLLRKL